MTVRGIPVDGGVPGDPGRQITSVEASPSASCDADPCCTHGACFQVQLEASRPQQAYRQALACAYHVADVIEALRAWARDQSLGGGQLTILAVEPAADGTRGPKTAGLREFAFTTIPLTTIPPGSVQRGELISTGARRLPCMS